MSYTSKAFDLFPDNLKVKQEFYWDESAYHSRSDCVCILPSSASDEDFFQTFSKTPVSVSSEACLECNEDIATLEIERAASILGIAALLDSIDGLNGEVGFSEAVEAARLIGRAHLFAPNGGANTTTLLAEEYVSTSVNDLKEKLVGFPLPVDAKVAILQLMLVASNGISNIKPTATMWKGASVLFALETASFKEIPALYATLLWVHLVKETARGMFFSAPKAAVDVLLQVEDIRKRNPLLLPESLSEEEVETTFTLFFADNLSAEDAVKTASALV